MGDANASMGDKEP